MGFVRAKKNAHVTTIDQRGFANQGGEHL